MLDDTTMIRAVAQEHPLLASARDVRAFEGQTICDIVRAADLDPSLGLPQVQLWRDGVSSIVPMTAWRHVRPKAGTTVYICHDTQGPAIAAVASAALTAAAPGIVSTFLPGLVGIGATLATAAITVVGGLLINSLVAPPKQGGGQGDPNFAITGVQNAAAKYRPIPLVCGRHRLFPPKSADGYSETIGGEIYWIGRYCIGWGRVGLEDIRIGNTPITEFSDVEIEFLNVDRDFTVANNPAGLENMVQTTRAAKQTGTVAVITKIGAANAYVYTPDGAVETLTIKIKANRPWRGSIDYNFRVDTRVVGEGWVAGTTYSDVIGEVTWQGGPWSDGKLREFRVVYTATSGLEIDEENRNAITNQFEPGISVTETSATFQQVQPYKMWRGGAEQMTLYPSDVSEEQFNVLLEEDTPVVRLTTNDAARAAVDISYPQGLYDSNDGDTQRHEANFAFRFQKVGDTGWTNAGTARHEADTQTLIRFTKTFYFPEPGEWRIEVTRTDPIDGDTGDQNSGYLTAIRSFTNERLPSHPRVSEIAIRIKATDQLNGQVDSLNMIAQQFAPKWTGTGWGPQEPVRHPAWIFAELLRGPHLRRPVADTKIDRNGLKAWAEEEPNWTFDYVFDSETRVADALDQVAAAGRARMHLADLRYSVIRDGADGPIRQVFTPRNSWGFRGRLAFSKQIHGFRVRFRSERLEWEEDEITVYLDGYDETNATEFETLELPGVVITENEVDRGNPYRLARYHLANAILRPETYEWNADFEHLAVTRGDKVQLVHDVPKIGVGQGRITEFGAVGGLLKSLVIDDIQPGAGGEDFRISVRRADGQIVQFSARNQNTFDGRWTVTEDVGSAGIAIGDLVAIEKMTQETMEVLITGIFQESDLAARLVGVPAAPAVLTADTEEIPPYAPIITDLPARFGPPKPVVVAIYSDERSAQKTRGGVLQVRIAVELENYKHKGPATWLRLRWTDTDRGGWIEGQRVRPSATVYSDLVAEGVPIAVDVRAEDSDGNHRGWVRAGEVFGSVGAPTQSPTNWSGRPVYDGIDFDGTDPSQPSNPAIQRGTDVAGWNIYVSDKEFGTYTFLQYTDTLKTLIADTADVRWFRFAVVNYSGVEGPLGPAFYVPPFTGLDLSQLEENIRQEFEDVFAITDGKLEDVQSGAIAELRDLAITPSFDRTRPLSERIERLARHVEEDFYENAIGSIVEQRVKVFEAKAEERDKLALVRQDVYARINEDASAEAAAREALGASVAAANAAIVQDRRATASALGSLATQLTQVEASFGEDTGAIFELLGTKVDAEGAVAAVNQQVSAEYGDLSALAEATAFAEATLEGIAEGFVWELGGNDVLTLIRVDDGSSPVITAKIDANYIRLNGNVQIDGGFVVGGGNIFLNAGTDVDSAFLLTGTNIQLDGNVTITGGFEVTGSSVRLTADTIINGNFVLAGDHLYLSAGTGVDSTFVLQGRHIELDGDVTIRGDFEVSGGNVRLNGNTKVDGTFEVTEGMIVDGLYLTKELPAVNSGDFVVTANTTVVALSLPPGSQIYAKICFGFGVKSNGASGSATRTCNWALFSDVQGKGNRKIEGGQIEASPDQTEYVGKTTFDPRPYNGTPVTLTLLVEPLDGGVTVTDPVILTDQSTRTS